MIKDVHSLSLADILPQNLMADKQITAVAQALDAKFQAVTADIVKVLLLPRLDELPEDIIDLLAWQWHVDFYEPVGMDIDTKRRLVRESVGWHHIKGTPAAVEKMIRTVYQTGTIQEWPEYDGMQYYFRVLLEETEIQTDKIKFLMKMIEASKNTRSWLDILIFKKNTDAGIYYGAFCETHKQYHLKQKTGQGGQLAASVFMGGTQSTYTRTKLWPKYASDAETKANLNVGSSGAAYHTVHLRANKPQDTKVTAALPLASNGTIHKIVKLQAET